MFVLELVDGQAGGVPVDVLAPVGLQQVPFLGHLKNILPLLKHRLVYLLVELNHALDIHSQVVLVGQGGRSR